MVKIPRIAIFGVGLIGGSLALSIKRNKVSDHVIGVGRAMKNLEIAKSLGAIDEIESDPIAAVEKSDLIVLSTPVNTISALIEQISSAMDSDKILTDVGSVKCGIVEAARKNLRENFSQFIPGHPIAGKEKSGIEAASTELFENHKVILTPVRETSNSALKIVQQIWQLTGAEVKLMDVMDHDRVLSVTSHLPHILAYVMMNFLSTSSDRQKCYEMAAGGFYDFTRTASSDPEMWRDIALMNSSRLLEHIEQYKGKLDEVVKMIEQSDHKGIENLFASAKQARSLVTEKRKNNS